MKSLIGILASFAMLHGEALACKDRSAQQEAAPKTRQTPAPKAAESPEANALYKHMRAARTGSAAAAKRLGEIYERGGKGVEPNYQESQKWHLAARSMGEDVPLAKCR